MLIKKKKSIKCTTCPQVVIFIFTVILVTSFILLVHSKLLNNIIFLKIGKNITSQLMKKIRNIL